MVFDCLADAMVTILSAAMMLRYTFGLMEETNTIEATVKKILDDGYRSPDIAK